MPTSVAGILTMTLGASASNSTACATSASVSRYSRGSVWTDSRPLRPRCSAKASPSRAAASTDSSFTIAQPISDSEAVGCSSAYARMRCCHRGRSLLSAARAMTGLQVAPTAPQPIAAASSAGVAESFHSTVGVSCVMRRSGGPGTTSVIAPPRLGAGSAGGGHVERGVLLELGPALRDDLGPRVEADAVGPVDVLLAEEAALPPAEGVVGHGHGNRHVDADHADLHATGELAGRAAVRGEDGRAVPVGVGVDQVDGVVDGVRAQHREDRTEDLLPVDRHVLLHLVDQRRAEEEAVLVPGDDEVAAVDDDLRAVLLARGDQRDDPVLGRLTDDRAHVAARLPAGADPHGPAAPVEDVDQLVADRADGDGRRDRHAPLPR